MSGPSLARCSRRAAAAGFAAASSVSLRSSISAPNGNRPQVYWSGAAPSGGAPPGTPGGSAQPASSAALATRTTTDAA